MQGGCSLRGSITVVLLWPFNYSFTPTSGDLVSPAYPLYLILGCTLLEPYLEDGLPGLELLPLVVDPGIVVDAICWTLDSIDFSSSTVMPALRGCECLRFACYFLSPEEVTLFFIVALVSTSVEASSRIYSTLVLF